MNIEIVQGIFSEAKKYCESKNRGNVFFELSHIETDQKAIFEFNRFKKEINLNDVIGENSKKRVILNLSEWNESYLYNKYLEAFLYMLSDMQDELDYKFMVEKEISNELFKKMNELKEFKFTLTALPTMVKEKTESKIGFCDNSSETGAERYV